MLLVYDFFNFNQITLSHHPNIISLIIKKITNIDYVSKIMVDPRDFCKNTHVIFPHDFITILNKNHILIQLIYIQNLKKKNISNSIYSKLYHFNKISVLIFMFLSF